jgi:murein DD-endopeptidase MepM/ murein hydrolase activator NlpD
VSSLRHPLDRIVARAAPGLPRAWRPRSQFAISALVLAAAAVIVLAQPWASQSRAGALPSRVVVPTAQGPAADASTAASAPTATPSATPSATRDSLTPLPISQLTGYVWPLANARITLPFETTDWGDFMVDGQRFHDGVDMATFCGDRIVAAHDGVVLAAGRHFDDFLGWQGDLAPYYARLDEKHLWNFLPIMVVIDDGNTYRSLYAHMSVLTVNVGDVVKAGQLIGYEGMTGNATGCHLHYGLFSPLEKATFGVDPGVATRMLLPSTETARVNPLLILPYRNEVEEMRTLRPSEAALCTQSPSPSPSPIPSASPSASPTRSSKPAATTRPTATATHAPSSVPPTAMPTATPSAAASAPPTAASTATAAASTGEEASVSS